MAERDRRGRRSGIGDARAYSPRGRSIREQSSGERVAAARKPREHEASEAIRRGKATGQFRVVRPSRVDRSLRMRLKARLGRIGPPKEIELPRMGEPKRRLRLATALSMLLFSLIGFRLVQLQVTDAPAYAAAGLQERLDSITLPAHRGTIFDRTGAVLAHSVEARYVAVDPEMVKDPENTAAQLAPLLGRAPSELLPLMQRKKQEISGKPVRFVWLARGVDVADGDKVAALKLPGIRVERDERRDVPGNDLAANIIGFTGTDLIGLGGVEARFDAQLAGHNGKLTYERGLGKDLSQPIPGGYQLLVPAQPGNSLKLTIDRDVQFECQRILFDRMQQVKADYGAAVILDVQTGEVIAQASYPTYSAADPDRAKPQERGDVATGTVVDPGSIHKAIVLSAALQEGVVKPDTTIEIGPTIKKGDTTFRDTHAFPQGTQITLPGLMAYSSNVATIEIASQLGADKLYAYQKAFGLGQQTGIGIPGEAPGLIQPPKNWSGSSYGSIPIGLGVSVTPLQMAAVYAAIANDGVWIQPHLIKETIAPDGKVVPSEPAQSHRVISPENAAALREIMEAVTSAPGATGLSAALPGYRVAGKTGTGQQVLDGRYTAGEVASFVGMAPADQPRFVIAVFAHSPSGTGGVVAGPAFKDMMAFTLRHFRVPPTGTRPPDFVLTQ